MASNEHNHIFLENVKVNLSYTSPSSPIESRIPQRDRASHGEYLIQRFTSIWEDSRMEKEERLAVSLPVKDGFYIEFKGRAGYELVTKSLENVRSDIRLLNIREEETEEGNETFATVYVPSNKTGFFLKKIRDYVNPDMDTQNGNPKNQRLLNSIEDVVLASELESFWQDSKDLLPQDELVWCEVWLLFFEGNDRKEVTDDFYRLCESLGIEYKMESLHFPERLVVMVKANAEHLKDLIESSDSIAEFRRAQETAGFWIDQENKEQVEWVKDLLARLKVVDTGVAVTILDGGVNNGHLLLEPILKDEDCHTYNQEWGVNDTRTDGHGTAMSGTVAYGDLQNRLESSLPFEVYHKLESSKILPPSNLGDNPYELWGDITLQAISRAEVANSDYNRVFCMAVTSDIGTDMGRPSSWSAAIDSVTSGAEDGEKRLFIVSAGNIRPSEECNTYPEWNKEKPIQNPAQSWNAITVGAFTNRIQINDEGTKHYGCLAPAGGVSPYSTTSCIWEGNKWPLKPDIVMEGGNLAVAPDGFIGSHEDLSSLTVSKDNTNNQFDFICATSEATARAAWFAAQLKVRYPNAWPETIRALMVHSGNWTEEMTNQFNIDITKKSEVADLLKICGHGVPNLGKALNSINNSLMLVSEEYIQPYCKRESGGGYEMKEMHLYNLPWPREELLALGKSNVRLRITLSYFIEPGPGEIGWRDRYRYPSHGLRFALNKPTESEEEFKQRINIASRDEDYSGDTGDSDRWVIGSKARNHGSLHSDYIECSAADIASCNMIGVYPIIGWWRERTNLQCMEKITRYSLLVSLHTDEQEVDLYTPIVNMIKLPVEIEVK